MANRDPAFLWETEALRDTHSAAAAPILDRPADWVSLRQASEQTGIPLPTLRNWARKGRVPSTLEDTPSGPRRMVSLPAVRERRIRLAQTAGEGAANAPEVLSAESPSVAEEEARATEEATPPPGTMLVPIDAWEKILLQLGNLHQAGQQLAEARERAARAETEAAFLRERLAELRSAARADTEPEPASSPSAPEPPGPPPAAAKRRKIPSFTAYLWRLAVSERKRG